MNLTELANKYGTDKGTQHYEAHNYTPIYEKYLEQYRDRAVKFMEIGVNDPRFPGASLKMWSEFFTNKNTKIYGVDINPPKELFLAEGGRINLLLADQSRPEQLAELVAYYGAWDVVLDDGLHTFECQINSFFTIFPWMNRKGLYFIEDCHAKDCHKTIELFKTLRPGAMDISSIEFYNNDKLIVITKI